VQGGEKNGAAVERQSQRGRGLKLAVRAVPPLLSRFTAYRKSLIHACVTGQWRAGD